MITLFVWWYLCLFEPGDKEYELPCALYPCLNLCAYLPILSTNPSTNNNLHTLFLLFLSSFDSKFILIGHSKQCLQSRRTRSVLKLERYAQRLPHRACMEEAFSFSWHLESPIAVRSALWVIGSFKALKKTSFFANFFPIPFKPAAVDLIMLTWFSSDPNKGRLNWVVFVLFFSHWGWRGGGGGWYSHKMIWAVRPAS